MIVLCKISTQACRVNVHLKKSELLSLATEMVQSTRIKSSSMVVQHSAAVTPRLIKFYVSQLSSK